MTTAALCGFYKPRIPVTIACKANLKLEFWLDEKLSVVLLIQKLAYLNKVCYKKPI